MINEIEQENEVHARKINYNHLLTEPQLAELKASKSNVMAFLTIFRVWITIAAAFCLTVYYPVWFTYLLVIVIIGAYQFSLVILMHDASHGLLHSNRKINDWLAEWLCAYPVMSTLKEYRPYHAQHHKYTELNRDPDLKLSRVYPVSNISFMRKIIRDITGIAGFRRYANTIKSVTRNAKGSKILALISKLRGFLLWNIIIAGLMTYFGSWYSYLLFWWVPLLTWYSLIYRLRNIAEHVLVPNQTGLDFARTTKAKFWYRWIIAPLNVNYHAEHHFFPWCPWYLLPRAHKMLAKNNKTQLMCIEKGYFSMLTGIFA